MARWELQEANRTGDLLIFRVGNQQKLGRSNLSPLPGSPRGQSPSRPRNSRIRNIFSQSVQYKMRLLMNNIKKLMSFRFSSERQATVSGDAEYFVHRTNEMLPIACMVGVLCRRSPTVSPGPSIVTTLYSLDALSNIYTTGIGNVNTQDRQLFGEEPVKINII